MKHKNYLYALKHDECNSSYSMVEEGNGEIKYLALARLCSTVSPRHSTEQWLKIHVSPDNKDLWSVAFEHW